MRWDTSRDSGALGGSSFRVFDGRSGISVASLLLVALVSRSAQTSDFTLRPVTPSTCIDRRKSVTVQSNGTMHVLYYRDIMTGGRVEMRHSPLPVALR